MIIRADARYIPLKDKTVDAIITDPPYGLKFMGKEWDHGVPGVEFWIEALRVYKPGSHLLAFGGTRTFHRLTCAIEDAGWEIRDCVMWVYGSGFPKSLDVSKAIDKAAGVDRPILSFEKRSDKRGGNYHGASESRPPIQWARTGSATAESQSWSGWGTALKPAWEPIIIARKPLDGTVAENVQKWGTGAMNIDECRIETTTRPLRTNEQSASGLTGTGGASTYGSYAVRGSIAVGETSQGRWPANLIHDGSEEVMGLFPQSKTGIERTPRGTGGIWSGKSNRPCGPQYGDSGSAARFFYTAKASRSERGQSNNHPTVKPVALIQYLIKLVTREGQIVLDPFCGSGTTVMAARDLGRVGIGLDLSYQDLAANRIYGPLFAETVNA